MSYVNSILAWCKANPALVGVIWLAFTALVSAFFSREESDPGKLGKVVRFVEAIGFDWRKALAALKALISGDPPAGGSASGSGATPPVAPPSGPVPPMASRIAAGLIARVVVALAAPLGLAALYACASTQSAAQTAQDELTVGEYEASLQGCILGAKANDAGFAGYEACADAVDQKFHAGKYADGGAE